MIELSVFVVAHVYPGVVHELCDGHPLSGFCLQQELDQLLCCKAWAKKERGGELQEGRKNLNLYCDFTCFFVSKLDVLPVNTGT